MLGGRLEIVVYAVSACTEAGTSVETALMCIFVTTVSSTHRMPTLTPTCST